MNGAAVPYGSKSTTSTREPSALWLYINALTLPDQPGREERLEKRIPCVSLVDHHFSRCRFRSWYIGVGGYIRKSVYFNIFPHDFRRSVGKVIRNDASKERGQNLSGSEVDDGSNFTRGISLA